MLAVEHFSPFSSRRSLEDPASKKWPSHWLWAPWFRHGFSIRVHVEFHDLKESAVAGCRTALLPRRQPHRNTSSQLPTPAPHLSSSGLSRIHKTSNHRTPCAILQLDWRIHVSSSFPINRAICGILRTVTNHRNYWNDVQWNDKEEISVEETDALRETGKKRKKKVSGALAMADGPHCVAQKSRTDTRYTHKGRTHRVYLLESQACG